MSLPDPLQGVTDDIVSYFNRPAPGASVPYFVYVYEPEDEFPVRKEMHDLRLFLRSRDIDCAALSLADMFWQAVDDSGFYDTIVAEERANPNDDYTLDRIAQTLHQILTEEPTLADRVLEALQAFPERCAVVLYRAGALYPVFRTSALLDDLRERLFLPVLLMYPGHVVHPHGLRFMGTCEPTHGYRAKIVQRGGG